MADFYAKIDPAKVKQYSSLANVLMGLPTHKKSDMKDFVSMVDSYGLCTSEPCKAYFPCIDWDASETFARPVYLHNWALSWITAKPTKYLKRGLVKIGLNMAGYYVGRWEAKSDSYPELQD